MTSNMVKRFLSTSVLLFTFLVLPFDLIHASLGTGVAIDKAGELRMLSQRIVKSYLMLAADVNPLEAQKQLDSSVGHFEQNLTQLVTYAHHGRIGPALDKVEDLWMQFRTTAILPVNKKRAAKLMREGEVLLHHSQKVVDAIMVVAGTKSAKMIDTSGRLRMLSQRIAKYYVAYYFGMRTPQVVDAFHKAVKEYGRGLKLLQAHKENTSDIRAKLERINSQWIFAKTGFHDFPDQENLLPYIISVTTESMLVKMHDVTDLYSKLHHREYKKNRV